MVNKIWIRLFPTSNDVTDNNADTISAAQKSLYEKTGDQPKALRSSLLFPITVILPLLLTQKGGQYNIGVILVTLLLIGIAVITYLHSYTVNVKSNSMDGKLKHNCILLIFLQFFFNTWTSLAFFIGFINSSALTYMLTQFTSWVIYLIVCVSSYRLTYKRYALLITKSASNARFYIIYAAIILPLGIVLGFLVLRMLPKDVLFLLLCFVPPCLGVALSRSVLDLRYYQAIH